MNLMSLQVGYTIRFEDVSSKERTRIRYMTDGMLFRETLVDPLLSRYSVIMIDEAHERSVYTDLLLGILKKIRRKRPSLRLIVSSATLDATSFLDYFMAGNEPNEATIVSLEGRMYPVEVAYLQDPTPDYVRSAAEVAWKINLQAGTGDILIFLTGREEIEGCLDELSELIPTLPKSAPRLNVLALHAGLSTESQLKVFEPAESGTRKIIIATNIAEIRTYNPTTGLASLSLIPTSVASATQRAGRAGRTSSGICYRLYPFSAFESLPHTTSPEITRVDLTTPILQLKSLGIDDLMKFEWVSAPPAESVLRALEGLVAAGMVGEDGRLTPVGEQVAECPVEVNIARMDAFIIPDGGASGALAELERRKFTAEEGDHLTLLNAQEIYAKIWFANGKLRRRRKKTKALPVRGNRILHIHPTSVLFTRKPRTGWVIFHEMEETKKTQIRIITEIEADWLLEYGHQFHDRHTGAKV
ncbi:hypothetical protein HWV62_17654 [Athelia sp. TMB]|nr:hypothetical protein HWV62_17654 [Athelia sp. TMB]